MATDDSTTEERIILATVSCIEKEGINRLTIRSIAREAGVNSAAINYYFRSKDNLVAKVMTTTLDHLFEDLDEIVADSSLGMREKLVEMLDYLIDGATRYPGVTRAHFAEALNGDPGESVFARRINEILKRLTQEAGSERADKDARRERDLRLVSLFSAAILPAVMPTFYRSFSGIDFRDSRTRKRYVLSVIERLYADI